MSTTDDSTVESQLKETVIACAKAASASAKEGAQASASAQLARPDDAMKYSQAALNAANALRSITGPKNP